MASVLILNDDVFLYKVLDRILSIGGHTYVGHAHDGTAEDVSIGLIRERLSEVVVCNPSKIRVRLIVLSIL